jgi:hypothetical protein
MITTEAGVTEAPNKHAVHADYGHGGGMEGMGGMM